jgi:CHASE2 domain-containing sensor protein
LRVAPGSPTAAFPRARIAGWLGWAAVALAAALGAARGLGSVDLALADLLRLPPRDAPPRIVIVAIDDASVAAVGRWPWRRLRHAELLEQLMPHRPRAIGLDLILSEAGNPAEDAVLADVMRRAGNVVVPVVTQPGATLEPIEVLARAAAATGRIDIAVDSDGVVRGVQLGAPGVAQVAHFAAAMHQVANGRPAVLPDWQRHEPALLDFRGPDPGYDQVPFAQVLAGRVPRERLEGAYVLVGATGTGLGDAYPTPGLPERGLRPGVHILATALEGLTHGRLARWAPAWANALANALPVLLAVLALRRLSPQRAWLAVLAAAFALLGASLALRQFAQVQVLPLAGLAGLLAAYVLWSAQRLGKVFGFVRGELARLRAAPAAGSGDTLDRHIDALRGETESVRAARDLLEQSLDALADAAFVTDGAGQVLVANAAARRLSGVQPRAPLAAALRARFPALPEPLLPASGQPALHPLRDAAGQDFLLKAVPRQDPAARAAGDGAPIGWVVSVADIGAAALAAREREQALGYASHDMRAPQTSILNLLELRRLGALGVSEEELLDRIGRLAEQTLSYADGFIQLARAEAGALRRAPHDLRDIATETADALWPRAQRLGVAIEVSGDSAVCEVDAALVARAVQNLLDNALKFSPAGQRIDCTVAALADGRALLCVRDRGPGIGAVPAETLFAPYRQADARAGEGAGLGLALVRTVARRHGGDADGVNAAGGPGALFRLWLPLAR